MTEPLSRLEQALTQIGSEHRPPEGWEARVLAAAKEPPQRRWWWTAVPMLALAVVIVAWLVLDRVHDAPGPGALALAPVTFDKPGTVMRSVATPHAGDVAHIRATGGHGYRALWIYRDDQLVAACPGWDGPGWCRAGRDASITDVPLASGQYMFLALSWIVPLPPSSRSYDADRRWAEDSGVTVRQHSLTIQ